MENVKVDLNEFYYSLNRARKQIKTMGKIYSSDKIIICMIFCFLLVIITIIIVSFVLDSCAEDENTKKEIFNN